MSHEIISIIPVPNKSNFKNLTGKKFYRWKVLGYTGSKNEISYYLCECECGTIKNIQGLSLTQRKSKSCGCLNSELNTTHGESKTTLYKRYSRIISRCHSESDEHYSNYGGRGIIVCDEWRNDYLLFKKWAEENGYRNDLTIERIDVNGNYCPENCCWIPMERQANNRRNKVIFTAFGETKTIADWSRDERCVVSYSVLYSRYIRGYKNEDAITFRIHQR